MNDYEMEVDACKACGSMICRCDELARRREVEAFPRHAGPRTNSPLDSTSIYLDVLKRGEFQAWGKSLSTNRTKQSKKREKARKKRKGRTRNVATKSVSMAIPGLIPVQAKGESVGGFGSMSVSGGRSRVEGAVAYAKSLGLDCRYLAFSTSSIKSGWKAVLFDGIRHREELQNVGWQ